MNALHALWVVPLGLVLVVVLGFLLFLMALIPFAMVGSYHYDYRCHAGVTEQRQYVDVFSVAVPVFSWEPLDGDPVRQVCGVVE
jgi:hypothetical protein